MAKTSIRERNNKKYKLWEKHKVRRTELRKILKDPAASFEDKLSVQNEFSKLKRGSCLTQIRRRCQLTGRPRGVYRITGLCRNMMRKYADFGHFPGFVKASW